MPEQQYRSKVIYFGEVLMDISGDDVLPSDVAAGKHFHKADGSPAVGTSTFDADTSDATANAAEILDGQTAYKNGQKITGTMPNIGSQTGSIDTKAGTVAPSRGYHDGGGSIGIAPVEQAKLVPENIREGVTILGVQGTMSGSEDMRATAVSLTPGKTAQTVVPSDLGNYNAISQVNVAAVPYTETPNAGGGLTVTIGSAS